MARFASCLEAGVLGARATRSAAQSGMRLWQRLPPLTSKLCNSVQLNDHFKQDSQYPPVPIF